MSAVIRCDWCEATTKEEAMVNWFSVEIDSRGFRVRTASDEPGPWHFCSPVCLQSWAFDRCSEDGRARAAEVQKHWASTSTSAADVQDAIDDLVELPFSDLKDAYDLLPADEKARLFKALRDMAQARQVPLTAPSASRERE